MTAPIMPPEAAAWIRENAWTPDMREMDASYPKGRGCFLYRISPCEMQKCGACDMGRCDLCIAREKDGEDSRWPFRWDANVTLNGRTVAHLYAVESQRCAGWVCTCNCRNPAAERTEPPPFPEERVAQLARPGPTPVQDALFTIRAPA